MSELKEAVEDTEEEIQVVEEEAESPKCKNLDLKSCVNHQIHLNKFENNNNNSSEKGMGQLSNHVPSSRVSNSRGQELMRRLCLLNPQFASSVLEDYIRPIVREDDVLLEIECGANAAILYLSRLCQGSKGPCIWFQDSWLTPNEFQYISGRETAKDWKRSIRHCGKSMKLLLTKGILSTHPPICDCDGCRISSPVNRIRLSDIRKPEDETSVSTSQDNTVSRETREISKTAKETADYDDVTTPQTTPARSQKYEENNAILSRQYNELVKNFCSTQPQPHPLLMANQASSPYLNLVRSHNQHRPFFSPFINQAAANARHLLSNPAGQPSLFLNQLYTNNLGIFDMSSTHNLLSFVRNYNNNNNNNRRDKEENQDFKVKKRKLEDSSSCKCRKELTDLAQWNVEQVYKFISSIEECQQYAQIFKEQSIDGETLLLLTEKHYSEKFRMKIGSILRLKSELAQKNMPCEICKHCKNCHNEDEDS